MAELNVEEPAPVDYDKKIAALEDELKRKDKIIEELKEKNNILFETAMKNSERKVDTRLKKKVDKS